MSCCSICVVAGQHDVRVARGIGDEVLADYGEEIFPREAHDELFPVRGATTAGFALNTNSDWIGGSSCSSPVRACTELPLIEHARARLEPVGPHTGSSHFTGKAQIGNCRMPAVRRRAMRPTSAGRQVSVAHSSGRRRCAAPPRRRCG